MGFQKDTILIYGGTGALGSLVALACAKVGYGVHVVVRSSTRSIKQDLCSKLEAAGASLVNGDFTGVISA